MRNTNCSLEKEAITGNDRAGEDFCKSLWFYPW